MAIEALLYIGCDGDGGWLNTPTLIAAILGFLARELSASPDRAQLVELGQHLQSVPVNRETIEQWFFTVYN